MRMLLKSWVPLPFSALVLSSMRGATRRAATRAGGAKPPGWVSRGGSEEGMGDLGVSPMSRSEDKTVPLVQQIYDELRNITDAEGEAQKGADSPVLAKVLRLMDALEAEDLGVSEEQFEGLTQSLSMPIFVSGRQALGDQETDPCFDLAVFVIPAGGGIPLHDHPRMSVLSRILFGRLEVDSYDLLDGRGASDVEAMRRLHETESRGFLQKAMVSLTRGDSKRGSGSRLLEARSQRRRRVDANSPSFLLTPTSGNIHTFRAPVTCAVFDVLVPPYDEARGRSCSYYRIVNRDGGHGARSGGSLEYDGSTRRGAADKGKNEDTIVPESRVMLERVPEPMELPIYSPYRGPMVVRRSRTGTT